MPPRKQKPLKDVNISDMKMESYKTLDQVLHPIFYDTKQPMFTLLFQMPTASTSRHQYSEGTNNTERRMIDGAKQSLALIQELTKKPVEFHYNTVKNQFIIALSVTASLTLLKDVVKIFITNLLSGRPFYDQIKILIATGQKITWEQERSHVHHHIIKPAVLAMMEKGKVKNLPEEYKSPTEVAGVVQNMKERLAEGVQSKGPKRGFSVDVLIERAYQSIAGHETNKDYWVSQPTKLKTQNNPVHAKYGQMTIETFHKKFLIGSAKSTELTKDKKIGAGMQFLISSAAFTIEELQAIKSQLEALYTKKQLPVKKPRAPSPY